MDRVPLKSAPSVGDLDAHLTQGSLGPPTQVCPPSIGSVVSHSAAVTQHRDTQTTLRATRAEMGRINARSVGDVVQKFRGPIHERSSDKLTMSYLITVESAFSPILIHPVLRLAVLPLVPSTHHSRHPTPLHSFISGLKPSFSANPSNAVAFLFLFKTQD